MFAEIVIHQNYFDLKEDLSEINKIKRKFSPYIIEDHEREGIRSYDPTLARWNYERFGYKNQEEFKAYEQIQIETFLGERFGVTKRPTEFMNIDGKIYSKDFPNQPFDNILERGIAYRAEEGSEEREREQSELEGWIKIREKLLDTETPLDSKFIVISGPGIMNNTNYPDNYIDLYMSKMDFKTKRRVIERKRFVSGLSYDEYLSEFKYYKPDYFNGFNGPLDAWFLKNPLFIDPQNPDKIFAEIHKDDKPKMLQTDFEKIFIACMPFIQFYINLLCDKNLKPLEILQAYNAIVNEADNKKCKLKQNSASKSEKIIYFDPEEIKQRVNYLGNQRVRNFRAGCGVSGGFNLIPQMATDIRSIPDIFSNSVAQFGIDKTNEIEIKTDEDDPLEFKCENGHKNTREPGKYKKYCSTCGCDVSCGIASAE